MGNGTGDILRLCEWSSTSAHHLSQGQREAIAEAATAWRAYNHLPALPLSFIGADGCTLTARQYVGVVEVAGVTVEVYPKLDAQILSDGLPPGVDAVNAVLRHLLWMMEVSDQQEILAADMSGLHEGATSFFEVFALLLARNLRYELDLGVSHCYMPTEGNLRMVRGRINLVPQITQNRNRFDLIACEWDEFSPDTPVNRLLRCACRFLSGRVRRPEIFQLLCNCLAIMEEVPDVSANEALRDIPSIHWDRATERFRPSFDLAARLLQGIGPVLGTGSLDTFVFFVDMNRVFEAFSHAVLEARFKVAVATQDFLGTLLQLSPGGMHQRADYSWQSNRIRWIGDAKYKHLARDQQNALTFHSLTEVSVVDAEIEIPTERAAVAGRLLSTDDVRQLTIYGELAKMRGKIPTASKLMLLYPFVGNGLFRADNAMTWSGTELWLVPVKVSPQVDLSEAIPILQGI